MKPAVKAPTAESCSSREYVKDSTSFTAMALLNASMKPVRSLVGKMSYVHVKHGAPASAQIAFISRSSSIVAWSCRRSSPILKK